MGVADPSAAPFSLDLTRVAAPPHRAAAMTDRIDPPNRRARRLSLDERTCRMICPVAAAMVGVCLTGIGLLHVTITLRARQTIADDLLSVDALTFLIATLSSYFALRVQGVRRLHWLEQIADATFITAMLLLTAACFLITYSLNR